MPVLESVFAGLLLTTVACSNTRRTLSCTVPGEVVAALDAGDSVALRSANDESQLCLAPARMLQGQTEAGTVQFIEGTSASSSWVRLDLEQGAPASFVGQIDFASSQCPAWSAAAVEACSDAGATRDATVRDAAAATCENTVDLAGLECGQDGKECDPAQGSVPILGEGATEVSLVDGIDGPASAYAFSASEPQSFVEGPAWTFFQADVPEDFAFRALIKRPEVGQVGTAQNPLCFFRLDLQSLDGSVSGALFFCFDAVDDSGGTLRVIAAGDLNYPPWQKRYECGPSAEWSCFSVVYDDSSDVGNFSEVTVSYAGVTLQILLEPHILSATGGAISAWGDGKRTVVMDQLFWVDDDRSNYACVPQ